MSQLLPNPFPVLKWGKQFLPYQFPRVVLSMTKDRCTLGHLEKQVWSPAPLKARAEHQTTTGSYSILRPFWQLQEAFAKYSQVLCQELLLSSLVLH